MAVHDVAMEPRQAEVRNETRARGEVGVVAGEEGGGEEWGVGHGGKGSPDVEGGVDDFFGEGGGEERERLIFALELAVVGEGITAHRDGAAFKEQAGGAIVAEGAVGGESEGEFAGEAGVAFAHGGDFAVVVVDDDAEGGIGGLGGVGERDAGIAGEGFADLGGEERAGLREQHSGLDRGDVEGGERGPGGAGAELVVRAAGSE